MPKCGICKRAEVDSGTCSACRLKRQERRAALRAAGRCLFSAGCTATPVPGQRYCPEHGAYHAAKSRESKPGRAKSIAELLNDFDAIL